MERYSGPRFGIAFVEAHAAFVDPPHHARDVLGFEGAAKALVAHVPPGGVAELALLDMERGGREKLEVADVIVVQVGNHHVAYASRVDAEEAQGLGRTAQVVAAALCGHGARKTGVDD